MPHDPSEEHISAEQQFRRLMETSEEDLPPVPDPAPDLLRAVEPPQGDAGGAQATTMASDSVDQMTQTAEGETPPSLARLVELNEQILAQLMVLQDTIGELLGGG